MDKYIVTIVGDGCVEATIDLTKEEFHLLKRVMTALLAARETKDYWQPRLEINRIEDTSHAT